MAMVDPAPAVIRAGAVLPCCARVPLPIGSDRYACRACGAVYRDAAAIVRAVIPGTVDVTALTPSKWVVRNHKLSRVEVTS
jgi:rubredoxin